jgi:Tfp pilus assembly protein PilV
MLVMTPFVIGILALITLHIKKSQNTDMANRRDAEYHSQELKQAPFAAV